MNQKTGNTKKIRFITNLKFSHISTLIQWISLSEMIQWTSPSEMIQNRKVYNMCLARALIKNSKIKKSNQIILPQKILKMMETFNQ